MPHHSFGSNHGINTYRDQKTIGVDFIDEVTYFAPVMKVVLQRVKSASVLVFDSSSEGHRSGQINQGLLLLVGFKPGDGPTQVAKLAQKIVQLRIFEDDQGKMNRSVMDIDGAVLIVSQFTLYGNTTKGRRPSFTGSMPPEEAEPLYDNFVQQLQDSGLKIATGRFGAKMEVELVNDGPVTFILEDENPTA